MAENYFESAHQLIALLEELDEKSLDCIGTLILSVKIAADPKSAATYYSALIDSALHQRFSVCLVCHSKHEPGDSTHWDASMTEYLGQKGSGGSNPFASGQYI